MGFEQVPHAVPIPVPNQPIHMYPHRFTNPWCALPSAALSVGMLGIAKMCFMDRRNRLLETLDSEPVPSHTIWNKQSLSIMLRVALAGKKTSWEINTHTLLDSGAEGIIILDQDFAMRKKMTLRTLVNPLPVKNVDGMMNKRGSVYFTMIQCICIKALCNWPRELTCQYAHVSHWTGRLWLISVICDS